MKTIHASKLPINASLITKPEGMSDAVWERIAKAYNIAEVIKDPICLKW
jgi:hypothetical protein